MAILNPSPGLPSRFSRGTLTSVNRTAAVEELSRRGHEAIARHYVDFYEAGWRGFETGFRDGDAARRALESASMLYEAGRHVVG